MIKWPKGPTKWIKDRTLYISIPFTWNLQEIKNEILQRSFFWDKAVVGGPAVSLMPDFFNDIECVALDSHDMPGVLQEINPLATKTTIGCIRHCKFCAVPKIEPDFIELEDWPDLPILIDNNILAASRKHFDKVIDRLKKHNEPIDKPGNTVDFNQGIDARLLKKYHANRIAEIKKPIIRLALDSMAHVDQWNSAFEKLRSAGLSKKAIRSYVLIGFNSGVDEAWDRCEYVNSFGIKALPMWYHALDAMEKNVVTEDQEKLGWTDEERKLIMQYYYQRGKGKATVLKKHKNRLKKLYTS